jgi:hypothetical protein
MIAASNIARDEVLLSFAWYAANFWPGVTPETAAKRMA